MSLGSRMNSIARILVFQGASQNWGSAGSYVYGQLVRCRIQTSSGSEYKDGKVRADVTHRIFLPAGTAVTMKDRINVNGVTYEVIGPVNDAGGGMGHHLEIDLKELQ